AGAWFGTFVATQWLVLHWLGPSARARVLVLGYGVCFIGCVITVGMLTSDPPRRLLGVVFGAMTMSCLLLLYTPLYYVVTNSLSVQSIIFLLERRGSLPREALYDRFASRHLLQGRLETLLSSGYVVVDGPAFRITPRGRRLIAPFLAIKSL